MYQGLRVLLLSCAYNEEGKIGDVFERLSRLSLGDGMLLIDDGSTDRTAEIAEEHGCEVIRLGACLGVGFALRRGLEEARARDYDVVVTIAGNNKDDPEEIPRLLDAIVAGHDFVIGSRFLEGGGYGGDMPFYRKFATRLHPFLVGLFCGQRITESTNGFRAMRLSVLDDERIDLHQDWLDHYELEVYLLMKLMLLDYRTTEVPCTKIYPAKKLGRTKMRPFTDWWKMLRPIFLLGLRLKR